MKYQNISVAYEVPFAIVTIQRESTLNALNAAVMSELMQFFTRDALELNGLKGVVLTGAGEKSFVAGADIKEFLQLEGSGSSLSQRGQDIFAAIERFHVPVIAAVNGFALGGGCELAMSCHLRIASANARFGQPEVNLGLIPGYGGTQRLIQYIGKGKALELMMTGDLIDAQEAWRLGLVNHVVPEGACLDKSLEILKKIATKAPLAVARLIECVNTYFDKQIDGYALEVVQFGELTGTSDFVEGANAFIEKRKPVFQGK